MLLSLYRKIANLSTPTAAKGVLGKKAKNSVQKNKKNFTQTSKNS
jgi:hypothetical protein